MTDEAATPDGVGSHSRDFRENREIAGSFESFDLLHTGRRLSVNATTELLVTTAERALCR